MASPVLYLSRNKIKYFSLNTEHNRVYRLVYQNCPWGGSEDWGAKLHLCWWKLDYFGCQDAVKGYQGRSQTLGTFA